MYNFMVVRIIDNTASSPAFSYIQACKLIAIDEDVMVGVGKIQVRLGYSQYVESTNTLQKPELLNFISQTANVQMGDSEIRGRCVEVTRNIK